MMRPEWIILTAATVLRIIFAYWNVFISPIIGSGDDAQGFHDNALNIANNTYTSSYSREQSYMFFLGYIYRITGFESQFFGSLISCIAWALSAVILIKIFDELGIKKLKLIGLIFYVALPSSVIYTSLTMREPFMLFFINCFVLSFLNLYKNNKIYINGLMAALFGIFIVLLNISFITSIAFIIMSGIIIKFTKQNCVEYLLLITFIALFFYFITTNIPLNYFNGNSLIDIINIRQDHFQKFARASYENGFITDSKLSLAKFIVISFKNYMIQPVDFDKMILKDYLLFLENLIRVGMFFLAVIGLMKSIVSNNTRYVFLFFLYLVIELTWASYTINWGTAVRHHLPSYGILTVLSIYSLKLCKKIV